MGATNVAKRQVHERRGVARWLDEAVAKAELRALNIVNEPDFENTFAGYAAGDAWRQLAAKLRKLRAEWGL